MDFFSLNLEGICKDSQTISLNFLPKFFILAPPVSQSTAEFSENSINSASCEMCTPNTRENQENNQELMDAGGRRKGASRARSANSQHDAPVTMRGRKASRGAAKGRSKSARKGRSRSKSRGGRKRSKSRGRK